MKKLIVTPEDTNTWELSKILNDEQVASLMSCLEMNGRIKSYELV
jgi:hypothetical protein